jgi:lipoprotein-releasing system permease protein
VASIRTGYEWIIGSRYLRSGHRNRFISFISVISMLGLALGVAVLIVVLSVMNGFQQELRQRILSMTAHATLMGPDGTLKDWRRAREIALANDAVEAAAPYVEDQAMLVNGNRVSGALVRGVLPEEEVRVSRIGEHLRSGRLEDLRAGRYNIVLGTALAQELGVKVGDQVVVVVAKGNTTPIGVVPRIRRFHVSGILDAGMYEFDRGLALVAMADAARLYRLGDGVTGVRLSFHDLFKAPLLVRDVALAVGDGFYVSDWTRKHANFFRSIELTKTIMFMILVLVVGVAAFNIVSTLVMIVKEKQSDIAILRTLGAGPRNILGIFIVQGAVIGLLGTLAGVVLGIILSNNLEALVHGLEHILDTHFLDAKVYFMSDLPAEVQAHDVWRIAGTAFALCCLSTLYPAWRAALTQPAEALRHE